MAKKKDTLDSKSNLKKNTEEMYRKTLEEMREHGASEEDIKLVEKARDEAIEAYDYVPNEGEKKYEPVDNNRYALTSILSKSPTPSVPLMDNLFIVHIGELPIYLVQSYGTNAFNNDFHLTAIETAEFSPEVYFSKKKKFDAIKVEFLSPIGTVLRTDTYERVKVKEISGKYLSYNSNGAPLTTQIIFKYKKHNVSTANKEERAVSETKVEDRKEA